MSETGELWRVRIIKVNDAFYLKLEESEVIDGKPGWWSYMRVRLVGGMLEGMTPVRFWFKPMEKRVRMVVSEAVNEYRRIQGVRGRWADDDALAAQWTELASRLFDEAR